MTRKSLLWNSLILVCVTAVLHFIALFFHFYWTTSWFDSIVHLCGGISVGFFTLWLSTSVGKQSVIRFSVENCVIILGAALFIGLLWEFFEWSFGLTFVTAPNYGVDTLSDLLMDVVGGFVALSYATFNKK